MAEAGTPLAASNLPRGGPASRPALPQSHRSEREIGRVVQMPQLWGRDWTREELEQRVGDMSQIAGVRLVELADGKERGVRAAEIKTGSGFNFTVLIDRGLDISTAEHQGKALAWRSMTEDGHPAYFEPEGLGWLRTFYGGLLVTCGMTWAGAPCEDEGKSLGLHGR